MLKVIEKREGKEAGEELALLDEIAREGARRMLMTALKAESDDYVERHRGERDQQGRPGGARRTRGKPELTWVAEPWRSRRREWMTAGAMRRGVVALA